MLHFFRSRIVCVFAVLALAVSAAPKASANAVADQAKAVFTASCYGCHGQPPNVPVAGLDILDVQAMIGSGLLVPGSTEFSLPYQYISGGTMPPPGATFPNGQTPKTPSPDDIAAIKSWIEAGAPDFGSANGTPRQAPAYRDLLQKIAADLSALPPAQAGRIRYLSLAHLVGTDLSPDALSLMRTAVAKLLNSLSMNPVINVPQTIDADQLIFRIDLADYKWVPATWRLVENAYPFGAAPTADAVTISLTKQITDANGTQYPVIRGDWFLGVACRPELYYDILFQDQMGIPGNHRATELVEKSLGIDRLGNIQNGRISRAGFSSSGVSVNNRIIERHAIATYPGTYWLSYDFSGTDPALGQDIFATPLGPAAAFPSAGNVFHQAASEVIFSLPNGMHAYMLVDAQDNRLNKALTTIVTDPARPDRAVEDGVSCFRCHNDGINLKQDAMHDYITANPDLFRPDLNVLLSLFSGKDDNFALQRSDLNTYLESATKIGIDIRQPEPITEAVADFEKEVDARRLAAELYLSEDQLQAKLKQSTDLRRLLGVLMVADGRLKRDFVLASYATIATTVASLP